MLVTVVMVVMVVVVNVMTNNDIDIEKAVRNVVVVVVVVVVVFHISFSVSFLFQSVDLNLYQTSRTHPWKSGNIFWTLRISFATRPGMDRFFSRCAHAVPLSNGIVEKVGEGMLKG